VVRVCSLNGNEYLLKSAYACLSGSIYMRRVGRRTISAVFRTRERTGWIRDPGWDWIRGQEELTIGCETFSPSETAKIKKWALGAKKPRRTK